MKLNYRFMILALMVGGIFLLPTKRVSAQAGDTLLVSWSTDGFNPTVNALHDAVLGDTVAGGGRANLNRVYKLEKGGFYWNTERIENKDFALRVVGETPGATALENPAVIQMVARSDGSVDGRIITGLSDVTLKNLWITGRDDNGVQTYYQPIQMDASNSRFIIDNCVLEQTNFALIAWTGKNNDIFYTNCKFRNVIGQPSTQQWEGRGMSIWADQDTVIVENCTFFNLGMTAFQLEGGAASYIRFNHNTIVNLGRSVNTGNWFREAYFANCLIVNGWWHGEGHSDISNPNRDPRQVHNGTFTIGALPSQYGPEQGRRIVFANCAAYLDPKFVTFYADSIRRAWFIDPVTIADFLSKYGPSMAVKDTMWLTSEPGLPTYPSDIIDDMIKNINDLRTNVTPAQPYFWMPTEYPTDVSWPLPEDFAYTDATLKTAGTDGLPLGDLNWFPAQKAQFEAGKAGFVKEIEDLAGPRIKLEVVETLEAEAGTVGGSAAVSTFEGFSYFQMDGGGFLEWTFDLPTAGQYDLNIWTHMRGNSQRGQHTFINGVEIHDSAHGWGELIYDNASGVTTGMEINDWTWVKWTQADINEADALTLPAGTNVIKISSSWGWQNFAGIDLLPAGTTTPAVQLRAPDVTNYEIVMPRGEGAPYTPSGFKSVMLEANGSISWNMNPPDDGNYRIQVFYQNYSGSLSIQFEEGTNVLTSLTLDSNTDSTGLIMLSETFPLTAGSHTISLTGSQAIIDFVQLIKETVITSVDRRNELPTGFTLKQNYPNPFNPTTNINFSVGKLSNVELTVYNVLGQKVAILVNQRMPAGAYRITWDAAKMASGLYFYTMKTEDLTITRKMMVIK
jgi:hypothetical protein